MPIEVVFHRLAAKEARAANAWYAVRSTQVAERFRQAVLDAAQRISDQVAVHPLGNTGFHYARVRHFPYRLIFRLESQSTARVLAVSHFRRRSGYWRRRAN